MDTALLVIPSIQSSEELLRRLDKRQQVRITAAMWAWGTDERAWRLYLATPDLPLVGPSKIYTHIEVALREPTPISDLGSRDIFLLPDRDPLVAAVRAALRAPLAFGPTRLTSIAVDDRVIDELLCLRVFRSYDEEFEAFVSHRLKVLVDRQRGELLTAYRFRDQSGSVFEADAVAVVENGELLVEMKASKSAKAIADGLRRLRYSLDAYRASPRRLSPHGTTIGLLVVERDGPIGGQVPDDIHVAEFDMADKVFVAESTIPLLGAREAQ